MDHKSAIDINSLSRISGLLFTLAAMRGATITEKLALEIECAAERLDLFIGDMIKEVCSIDEETISNLIDQIANNRAIEVTPDQ